MKKMIIKTLMIMTTKILMIIIIINQNARPIEKQLEALLFVLYYINRIYDFHLKSFAVRLKMSVIGKFSYFRRICLKVFRKICDRILIVSKSFMSLLLMFLEIIICSIPSTTGQIRYKKTCHLN